MKKRDSDEEKGSASEEFLDYVRRKMPVDARSIRDRETLIQVIEVAGDSLFTSSKGRYASKKRVDAILEHGVDKGYFSKSLRYSPKPTRRMLDSDEVTITQKQKLYEKRKIFVKYYTKDGKVLYHVQHRWRDRTNGRYVRRPELE